MTQLELFSVSSLCDSLFSLSVSHPSAFERSFFARGYQYLAGVDEAGRGPLAGPVVVCACMMVGEVALPHVMDSKLLRSDLLNSVYASLISHPRILYAVTAIDATKIDCMNILQATLLGMQRAVESLRPAPQFVVVDGNKAPYFSLPVQAVVKADRFIPVVSAASIIAKCTRDHLMCLYHQKWPEYRFDLHKGYGTAFHLEMLQRYGPSPIHRRSFHPVKQCEKEAELFL